MMAKIFSITCCSLVLSASTICCETIVIVFDEPKESLPMIHHSQVKEKLLYVHYEYYDKLLQNVNVRKHTVAYLDTLQPKILLFVFRRLI
jgi:hypothetical protein